MPVFTIISMHHETRVLISHEVIRVNFKLHNFSNMPGLDSHIQVCNKLMNMLNKHANHVSPSLAKNILRMRK